MGNKQKLLSVGTALGTAQSLGLGREALKILEEAVLACPSILVGDDPYIDYKTFQAVLENVHTAFKHEDMSIMTRERGYKTQPVDIEENENVYKF